MVVRLNLHQDVDRRFHVSVNPVPSHHAESTSDYAFDDRGVVFVSGNQPSLIGRLRRLANLREQRLRSRFAVDRPVRVEYLVTAVFGVRLREHHQFHVCWITTKLFIDIRQKRDFSIVER